MENSSHEGPIGARINYLLSQSLAVLLIGLSIGWITGLSVSQVVSGIVAALLSISAGTLLGLSAFLSNYKKSSENDKKIKQINAWPAALFAFGIAIGASAGLAARAHGLLIPPTISENSPEENLPTPIPKPPSFGLHGSSTQSCSELLVASKSQENGRLRQKLQFFGWPWSELDSLQLSITQLNGLIDLLCTEEKNI